MARLTLYCDSRGDQRFSPFFAQVEAFGVTDTIEDHYQKSKVFVAPDGSLRHPSGWREAKDWKRKLPKHTHFRLPNGRFVPNEFLIFGWYAALWLKFFDLHPRLVEEASRYDVFVDRFKGDFPLCQADCVRLYAKEGRAALLDHCRAFFEYLRHEQ